MKKLAEKANEQIQKIKDWYEEHKEAFDYMNLKLHDVSWYCYSKMENDFPLCYANDRNDEYSYFYMFCESEYDFMLEDLKENDGIDFKDFCYHLGRTSSFYLHNQEIFQFERFQINWYWTMNQIVSEILGSYYGSYTEFDKDGFVDLDGSTSYIEANYADKEGAYENLREELEWLATKMYDDVLKHFNDMLKVYEYIKNFKENQVEIFKEWIHYYEDEHAEEKRKADEESEKRLNIIAKMPEKVHNIMKRSALDSEDLDVVLGCMV